MYSKNTQSNEKCFSTSPGRLPHTKYRENKKYQCFCNKLFNFVHTEGLCMSNCDLQRNSRQRKNYLDSIEKATQMEKKTKEIYDAYILDTLLNKNNGNNKTYVQANNSYSMLGDRESLTDIKKILVTTNDKLDLILKTLTEKHNHKHKEQNKQKKAKPNKMRSKTASALMIPSQNGLSDLPSLMKTQPHCVSATRIPKLRMKECSSTSLFYVSPYNSSYYMYGTNMSCFKKFGTKCSEKAPNNVWNPFIFMATHIDTKKIKIGDDREKLTHHYGRNIVDRTDQDSLNFNTSMELLSSDQD